MATETNPGADADPRADVAPPAPGPPGAVGSAADGASSRDPDVGLRAVAALRRLAEDLEALQVVNAREQGWSWQRIADALGVTKQTVHRKHAGGWRRRRGG